MDMRRRDFLRFSAMAAGIAALGGVPPTVEKRNDMPYRTLGKTGEKVSLLCLGGFHMGVDTLTEEESIRLVRTAVDEGVNFLDNAYIYHKGRSEERMGKALRDGYRDKVFLMTKVFSIQRDVAAARKQLDESLLRLQTDHIDLWQVHQIHAARHPEAVYSTGLLDFLQEAREQGKIRYIGFTGHTRPEFNADMIDRGFAWDTTQMPLNAFDHHWVSFRHGVLPKALEKDMGVIAMKTLGGSLRRWKGELVENAKTLTAEECIRYAMNLPVSTVCSGMDSMDVLQKNLAIAKSFRPLEEAEVADILARTQQPAQGGEFEPYKGKTL
ncbi:MAG: aldo/keto reductase [bacterium]|nr:aldo/keto reductase [bacterium]